MSQAQIENCPLCHCQHENEVEQFAAHISAYGGIEAWKMWKDFATGLLLKQQAPPDVSALVRDALTRERQHGELAKALQRVSDFLRGEMIADALMHEGGITLDEYIRQSLAAAPQEPKP